MTSMCGCGCCKRWNAFADEHYRPLITENKVLRKLVDDYIDAYDKDCLIEPVGVVQNMQKALDSVSTRQKPILFRPHRSSLDDAMKEVIEIADRDALVRHLIRIEYANEKSDITVEKYVFDDRIGWDTHIVCINGNAIGFTNAAV